MKKLVLSLLSLAGILSLTNCETTVESDHNHHRGTTTTTTEETTIRSPLSTTVETQTMRSY